MKLKGKIIVGFVTALVILLVLATPAQGIMTQETCINTTHLLLYYNYTLVTDSTSTIYSYNQTHECTNGCTNNRCTDPTEQRVVIGSIAGMFASAFVSVLMCWLGLKFETKTAFESTQVKRIFESGIKVVFLLVGIFFALNTVGIARTVMVSGSASVSSLKLIDTIITNMGRVLYFFMAMVMLGFLMSVIFYYVKSTKALKGEYRR